MTAEAGGPPQARVRPADRSAMLPGRLSLPTGLGAGPLTPADAAAVTALVAACERHDDGRVEVTEADVVADWQRPSMDLFRHSVGVRRGPDLVAAGEVYRGRRAEVSVRPDARGLGIGAALLRWTWAVARAEGAPLVGQTVSDAATGAVALFRAHGYASLWTSWILETELTAAPAEPVLPPGYALRPGAPDEPHERAAYQVVEDAFNEWPDRDPVGFDDWAATAVRRPGFRPEHLALVTHDGAVVAVACLLDSGADGLWVHQLAVRRDHRGRGLGRVLLQHAFGTAWRAGQRRCGLSTDSRTGALGLYEHVGMRVVRSYTHWAKDLTG